MLSLFLLDFLDRLLVATVMLSIFRVLLTVHMTRILSSWGHPSAVGLYEFPDIATLGDDLIRLSEHRHTAQPIGEW